MAVALRGTPGAVLVVALAWASATAWLAFHVHGGANRGEVLPAAPPGSALERELEAAEVSRGGDGLERVLVADVAVDAPGSAPEAEATIRTIDAVIAPREGARILGRLGLPEAVDPTSVTVIASFPGRHDRDRWARADSDGSFELDGLDQGWHVLEVGFGDPETVRIGGGLLEPGERVDVGEIDLRQRLFTRRIDVVDELGRGIAGATVARGFDLEPLHTDETGSIVLASAARTLELAIQAPGRRPESVRCDGDARVTLRPGIPVQLVLGGAAPELPEGCELEIELREWPRGCTFVGMRPAVGLWRGSPRRGVAIPLAVPRPGRFRAYVAVRAATGRSSASRAIGCGAHEVVEDGLAAPIPIELDLGMLRELVAQTADEPPRRATR